VLQGQYSFALYDGEKRQVFAARDSSGSEPLFFEVGEDGGLNLSNSQPMVPAAESSDDAHVKVRRRRRGGKTGAAVQPPSKIHSSSSAKRCWLTVASSFTSGLLGACPVCSDAADLMRRFACCPALLLCSAVG
jgi:hypothetical protein